MVLAEGRDQVSEIAVLEGGLNNAGSKHEDQMMCKDRLICYDAGAN